MKITDEQRVRAQQLMREQLILQGDLAKLEGRFEELWRSAQGVPAAEMYLGKTKERLAALKAKMLLGYETLDDVLDMNNLEQDNGDSHKRPGRQAV